MHLPGTSHRNTVEQQQEVREARRLLKERIRNDWEYPTLPAWKSSGRSRSGSGGGGTEDLSAVEERIAGFRFRTPGELDRTSNGGSGQALGLDFDPVAWREREYSSEEDVESDAPSSKGGSSAYKFDNPDSVGTQLTDRRIARKRKRYEALEEEMEWNDGLVHWTRRRDAWCCVRTATEVRLLKTTTSPTTTTTTTTSSSSSAEAPSPGPSASTTSSPRTSTSTTSSSSTAPATSPPPTTLPSSEPLVPLAPPLLPNHPIRRRISPSMYPVIYSKIILQARTPSVPINLAPLLHALVHGWKSDGEWPPKPAAAPEKSVGGRKKGAGPGGQGGGLREGVKAVGRVLRLTGVAEAGSRSHHG